MATYFLSTPVHQSAHKISRAQLHRIHRYGCAKFKKRVTWPWPRSLCGDLSSQGQG